MGSDIWAAGLGEMRAMSTADGGTALTTTATYIGILPGTEHIFITPRNFSASTVAQHCLNPYLAVLKTTDAMATAPTDYSSAAQDCSDSTVITLTSLDTLANGDYLLIGAHLPFRGFYVTMSATVNATPSVMTVHYWKSDLTWADTSATDGTDTAGTTISKSGLVYWTVPSDWVVAKLTGIYTSTPKTTIANKELFWVRVSFSAALDSATATAIYAANRSTAYPEYLSGQPFEQRIKTNIGGYGCVEALMASGTGNLVVNGATERSGAY